MALSRPVQRPVQSQSNTRPTEAIDRLAARSPSCRLLYHKSVPQDYVIFARTTATNAKLARLIPVAVAKLKLLARAATPHSRTIVYHYCIRVKVVVVVFYHVWLGRSVPRQRCYCRRSLVHRMIAILSLLNYHWPTSACVVLAEPTLVVVILADGYCVVDPSSNCCLYPPLSFQFCLVPHKQPQTSLQIGSDNVLQTRPLWGAVQQSVSSESKPTTNKSRILVLSPFGLGKYHKLPRHLRSGASRTLELLWWNKILVRMVFQTKRIFFLLDVSHQFTFYPHAFLKPQDPVACQLIHERPTQKRSLQVRPMNWNTGGTTQALDGREVDQQYSWSSSTSGCAFVYGFQWSAKLPQPIMNLWVWRLALNLR